MNKLKKVIGFSMAASTLVILYSIYGLRIQQVIANKDIKCSEQVITEGLCQAVLGQFIQFNWKTKKCEESYYSGCRLLAKPDFDLGICQKLCEK